MSTSYLREQQCKIVEGRVTPPCWHRGRRPRCHVDPLPHEMRAAEAVYRGTLLSCCHVSCAAGPNDDPNHVDEADVVNGAAPDVTMSRLSLLSSAVVTCWGRGWCCVITWCGKAFLFGTVFKHRCRKVHVKVCACMCVCVCSMPPLIRKPS